MLCRLAVLVALVAAVACAARSDPFQWSQCGDRKFGVVNNVTLAPYPAQKGKKATAVALVRIAQVITSGTWDLKLKLHGIIPAPGQNGGICDVVSGGCPVKVGLHNATIVIPVPDFAPSGPYTGRLLATNGDGVTVLCVDMKLSIA